MFRTTFRKPLAAAVAALTVAGTLAASTGSAEAHWRGGPAIAAGVFGLAVAGMAAAAAADAYGRPAYAPVYGYGCGTVRQPVYDIYGVQVGWRRVPAC
ncbi:hypothetical protein [Methylobacterium sp. Leaf118]|uniref:hypothetical protein n=1 Tax=Methylobacterium sp. Leaf118 TaxID=2876562 RepID=UPI001E2F20F3|nr:hypothetical protein [Methylobacterium sp. Leaf118]